MTQNLEESANEQLKRLVEKFDAKEYIRQQEAYPLALGKFVQKFSEVEGFIQLMVRTLAGINNEVGIAVFSGVRPDAARDIIGRILTARKMPESSYLKRGFDRFGVITRARNDILHYGAKYDMLEAEWNVSNEGYALPGKERKLLVGPEILDSMREDLLIVLACFQYYIFDLGNMENEHLEMFKTLADRKWHYNPPQQSVAFKKRKTRS